MRYKVRELKGRFWVVDHRKRGVEGCSTCVVRFRSAYLQSFATRAEAEQVISELEDEDKLYGEGWEDDDGS